MRKIKITTVLYVNLKTGTCNEMKLSSMAIDLMKSQKTLQILDIWDN